MLLLTRLRMLCAAWLHHETNTAKPAARQHLPGDDQQLAAAGTCTSWSRRLLLLLVLVMVTTAATEATAGRLVLLLAVEAAAQMSTTGSANSSNMPNAHGTTLTRASARHAAQGPDRTARGAITQPLVVAIMLWLLPVRATLEASRVLHGTPLHVCSSNNCRGLLTHAHLRLLLGEARSGHCRRPWRIRIRCQPRQSPASEVLAWPSQIAPSSCRHPRGASLLLSSPNPRTPVPRPL